MPRRDMRWMVVMVGSLFAIGAMAPVACGPATGNKPADNGKSNANATGHDNSAANNEGDHHDHDHGDEDPHHEYLEHHMEEINAQMRTISRSKDGGFVKSEGQDPQAASVKLAELFSALAASDAAKAHGDQFIALANAASTAANGLKTALAVAPKPDATAAGAALGAMGGSCKGCHDVFRKKD